MTMANTESQPHIYRSATTAKPSTTVRISYEAYILEFKRLAAQFRREAAMLDKLTSPTSSAMKEALAQALSSVCPSIPETPADSAPESSVDEVSKLTLSQGRLTEDCLRMSRFIALSQLRQEPTDAERCHIFGPNRVETAGEGCRVCLPRYKRFVHEARLRVEQSAVVALRDELTLAVGQGAEALAAIVMNPEREESRRRDAVRELFRMALTAERTDAARDSATLTLRLLTLESDREVMPNWLHMFVRAAASQMDMEQEQQPLRTEERAGYDTRLLFPKSKEPKQEQNARQERYVAIRNILFSVRRVLDTFLPDSSSASKDWDTLANLEDMSPSNRNRLFFLLQTPERIAAERWRGQFIPITQLRVNLSSDSLVKNKDLISTGHTEENIEYRIWSLRSGENEKKPYDELQINIQCSIDLSKTPYKLQNVTEIFVRCPVGLVYNPSYSTDKWETEITCLEMELTQGHSGSEIWSGEASLSIPSKSLRNRLDCRLMVGEPKLFELEAYHHQGVVSVAPDQKARETETFDIPGLPGTSCRVTVDGKQHRLVIMTTDEKLKRDGFYILYRPAGMWNKVQKPVIFDQVPITLSGVRVYAAVVNYELNQEFIHIHQTKATNVESSFLKKGFVQKGDGKRNFVKTMLTRAEEKGFVESVPDSVPSEKFAPSHPPGAGKPR